MLLIQPSNQMSLLARTNLNIKEAMNKVNHYGKDSSRRL